MSSANEGPHGVTSSICRNRPTWIPGRLDLGGRRRISPDMLLLSLLLSAREGAGSTGEGPWIRKNRDFSRFFKVVPAEGLEPPPDFKWPKTAFLLAFLLRRTSPDMAERCYFHCYFLKILRNPVRTRNIPCIQVRPVLLDDPSHTLVSSRSTCVRKRRFTPCT